MGSQHVDLSPVCEIGSEPVATSGLKEVVDKKIKELNMTLEAAFKLFVETEPPVEPKEDVNGDEVKLPAMKGIMSDDDLYVNYLKHWEAGGEFDKNLTKVGEGLKELDKNMTSLFEDIKKHGKKVVNV